MTQIQAIPAAQEIKPANPFVRVARPHGLGRWIPGLAALRTYQRPWLAKDLMAGLVLTAILVPVGMGYAEAAGLPAIYGLYATIVPLIAYAIFGPSRILVLGPDSSLAAIIAATIVPLAAGDPDRLVALAGMLALLTGALCLLAGLARFGFITDLLSKPIRLGYLNGIALTVLVGQLPKLLGFSASGDGLIQETISLVRGVAQGMTNPVTLAIGVACLAIVLIFKRWWPKVPGVLVAVVGATIVVGVFNLAARAGVSVVGPLPQGLPSFQIPWISAGDLGPLLAGAIAITLVSFADTSVLSRTFALRGGYEVDQNQELIALGAANIAAGLFQGFSISSSSSRTPVAESAGSKTQLTGVVGALCIAALLVFAPTLLQNLPNAALGAVVIASLSVTGGYQGCRALVSSAPRRVCPFHCVFPGCGTVRRDPGHLYRHRPGPARFHLARLAALRCRVGPRRTTQRLSRYHPLSRGAPHSWTRAFPVGRTALLCQCRDLP